jgi:hypothetical protein
MDSFDQFWAAYPRRVKPLLARKALDKALKVASLEDILAGVERYKQTKPAWCDWAHPTSWLNAGRWMDEADAPKKDWSLDACPHRPKCGSPTLCQHLIDVAEYRQQKGRA